MMLLAEAIRADLQAASDFWDDVVKLSTNPKITPLRALDIVAWSVGKNLPPQP